MMKSSRAAQEFLVERRERATLPDDGFTLLEMLCVVAILAVAVSFVLPGRLSVPDKLHVEAAIRRMALVAETARARAVGTNREVVVTLDMRNRTAELDAMPELRFDRQMELSVIGSRQERLNSDVIGIRFFPDGTATGADIRFRQKAVDGMLSIDWLTGAISRQVSEIGSSHDG